VPSPARRGLYGERPPPWGSIARRIVQSLGFATFRLVDGDIRIEEPTEVSDELVSGVGRLVEQLSASSPAPSAAQLEEIVRSDASRLLIARDDESIVGTLSLILFRIPTGMRAWIEDVVVDESARERGVGAALMRAALEMAGENGARTVDLTSRPTRHAANRLYASMGFSRRDTNVYRFEGALSAHLPVRSRPT
jgi:ribosomal protein S18 acetylase RimI-like enzyme